MEEIVAVMRCAGDQPYGLGSPANTPSLDDAVDRTEQMIRVARAENPDVIVLTHGGPIATPEDVKVVLAQTTAQGFVGASTMERLPVESAIQDTVQAFKSVPLRGGDAGASGGP